MAIVFSKVSSFAAQDVDDLFEASRTEMEGGTVPANPMGMSLNEFKTFLKNGDDGMFTHKYKCEDNNYLVGLYFGYVVPSDPDYLYLPLAFYRQNENNTKSWLYSSEYDSEFKRMLDLDSLVGVKAKTLTNSKMDTHTGTRITLNIPYDSKAIVSLVSVSGVNLEYNMREMNLTI